MPMDSLDAVPGAPCDWNPKHRRFLQGSLKLRKPWADIGHFNAVWSSSHSKIHVASAIAEGIASMIPIFTAISHPKTPLFNPAEPSLRTLNAHERTQNFRHLARASKPRAMPVPSIVKTKRKDPKEFLKPKMGVGSIRVRMDYDSEERAFHSSEMPTKAVQRRTTVHEWKKTSADVLGLRKPFWSADSHIERSAGDKR